MRIQFSVKSNTGGHHDYDDCDLLLKTIDSDIIPRIGETVKLYETNEAGRKEIHDYLVREVQYLIDDDYCEATVCVIPIGFR